MCPADCLWQAAFASLRLCKTPGLADPCLPFPPSHPLAASGAAEGGQALREAIRHFDVRRSALKVES